MTRVISFASGKGGVGKTTLVANLGHLWANQGKQTLLIDGDWALGKLSITLGVRPEWTMEKVLKGGMPLSQAIQPVTKNLSMLASPSGVMGLEELSPDERNVLFFEIETLANQYDLILFDHSSGIHWNVLQFAAASHQHVIVTTPEPTSYTDAYAIMKILSKRFAIRHFLLLVTMSQTSEAEGIVSRFIDVARSHLDVRVTLLSILPWEPRLADSIRRQQAFVQTYPGDILTRTFQDICKQIENKATPASHGLKFFYHTQDDLCPMR